MTEIDSLLYATLPDTLPEIGNVLASGALDMWPILAVLAICAGCCGCACYLWQRRREG